MPAEGSGRAPDAATTLLMAETKARALGAPLDRSALPSQLTSLARAARSGDDAAFVPELAGSASPLLAYLVSFELDDSPPGLLRS